MGANRKVILIVIMGAGACLLSFMLSQYFARKNHDNHVLLAQVRQLAPRVEQIRLLSRHFIQSGDTDTWGKITGYLEALNLDLAEAPRASRRWTQEIDGLKKDLTAYRHLLARVYDPAVGLKDEKIKFKAISLSFSEEVDRRIIAPYRKEEALHLYKGHWVDPFKTRIKETAHDVLGLHLQQQLILMELLLDWDVDGYNRKKQNLARELQRHKTQLHYMNILMGSDPGIEPIIDSLNQKMDRLVNHEKVILDYFSILTQLNEHLTADGGRLLEASEKMTTEIVAEISAANRLNQLSAWGVLVPILGGLGFLGALLARDIIRFVKDLEAGREALRESEERLYLALSGADQGVWDWHLDDDTLYFDDGYYTISGYAPGEFPAAFTQWEKRVHPSDVQRAKDAIEQYLSGELENFDIEFRFLRKDGGYMWIQGRGKIVSRNEQGAPIRFVGTHADITRRKKMEESLRITQFSIDKAAIGIFRIASDARILDVNHSAASVIGYTRQELATMSVFDIDPAVNAENWGGVWQRFKDRKVDIFETTHRTKDGRCIAMEINSNLFEYGGKEYSICFAQDITKRKEDDAELRRLRNYLANIIDSMPSVLVGVDSHGKVTQWNRQAEQVAGLSVAKALFQPLAQVFPRLKNELDRVQTAIRDRQVLKDLKVPRQDQDGIRYEDVTIFPLVANGVEGAVIRVDDVTERVRLEEMMIQSEKMLSVGGLAAGMAHEINNPLAGILQSTSVLSNRLTGALPANQKAAEAVGTSMEAIRRYAELRKLTTMLDNIRTSGTLAADIVKNMLSFARKSEQVIAEQDLSNLLDQTLDLLKTDYDMKKHYDFKQIEIVRQFDTTAPPVPCESSKIQQVFMNILKNGAEAMAETAGGDRSPTFILRVQAEDAWVRVEIEDNGPGMEESIRRRIFEPFFTTKPVGRGTGLGLSVSYFIIAEDHGGEMDAREGDRGGTRFIIRLPKKGKTNHD